MTSVEVPASVPPVGGAVVDEPPPPQPLSATTEAIMTANVVTMAKRGRSCIHAGPGCAIARSRSFVHCAKSIAGTSSESATSQIIGGFVPGGASVASALWRGIYGVEMPYAPFNIQLVALSDKPLQFGGHITLRPHTTIATARKPELILIPSVGENVLENLESLRPFVPWIKLWASKGTRVVSLCSGAFLLAETGLLDGRSATTHWFLAGLFRKTYPQIRVHPERLIVDEGSVITSGVATSFLDLMLYIIELYNGREGALLVAKAFLIEMGRRTRLLARLVLHARRTMTVKSCVCRSSWKWILAGNLQQRLWLTTSA